MNIVLDADQIPGMGPDMGVTIYVVEPTYRMLSNPTLFKALHLDA